MLFCTSFCHKRRHYKIIKLSKLNIALNSLDGEAEMEILCVQDYERRRNTVTTERYFLGFCNKFKQMSNHKKYMKNVILTF